MTNTAAPIRLTFTHWLIIIIASIGFAFDIYELLVAPLILRPALEELAGLKPTDEVFGYWKAAMFYVPAFTGGIFGLYGGYLTDRLGRRRVLTWSILLYAISALLAGYSTSAPMLLVLRCTTWIGVCVEFVAAVAWLSELFPNPRQRERVLGYTQAFSSVGGLLVAIANNYLLDHASVFPAIALPNWFSSLGTIGDSHAAWRYTLMSGVIPAIPLIVIRPFLPESPIWKQKKEAGTLKRPSIAGLFSPELRRTTIVTTVMVACSYGAAFGAIQQIPDMVPGLKSVQEQTAGLAPPKKKEIEQKTASEYTKVQEIGGLTGRFLLAVLTVQIVSRRALLRVFQIPGLFIVPAVFALFLFVDNQTFFVVDLSSIYAGRFPFTTVSLGVFVAGLFTVAQFSFWGNYLPRVYPIHLRGTGEGFAANIGGRMFGTAFAAITNAIAVQSWVPGETAPLKMAYTAAAVAAFVYLAGSIACFFLPEPHREALPD